MLSEITQTEKDEYHVIDYMWNLKKKNKTQMNLFAKQKSPFPF